jgi:hypothetical protein
MIYSIKPRTSGNINYGQQAEESYLRARLYLNQILDMLVNVFEYIFATFYLFPFSLREIVGNNGCIILVHIADLICPHELDKAKNLYL